MPPFHTLILASLVIIPFVYSITLLIVDTQTPPYRRTVRALGSGVLIKGGIGTAFGMIGLVIERQIMTVIPLVLIALACTTVYHILQNEGI